MDNLIAVYGGSGAVGFGIVQYFVERGFKVISIDLTKREGASSYINVDVNQDLNTQGETVLDSLAKILETEFSGLKLKAVINAAGGWAGGNLKDENLFANVDLMIKQSVYSSVISAKIASAFLCEDGLVVNFGAQAAENSTPSMIAYGLAKAAVHQLTKSLRAEDSGLPQKADALTILPVTIDTPSNRKWISGADYSTWTPIETIAEKFYLWVTDKGSIPKSGNGLVTVVTAENVTTWTSL